MSTAENTTDTLKTTRLKDTVTDFVSRNLILLSVFTGIFIILTGLTLKNAPSMWWVPAIFVAITTVVALLFINARVAIKATIAAVVTLFVSGFAMQMGSFLNPYAIDPFFWFSSFWFVFAASLAYSYVNVKGRSRWSTLIAAEMVAFVVSYFVAFVFLSPLFAAVASVITGLLSFIIIYNLGASITRSSKHGPINVSTDAVVKNLFADADNSDWNIRHIDKKNSDYFLAWRDKAFSLVPVVMDEQFGQLTSKRGKNRGVGYHNRSINPWLSDMVHDKTMFFRSGGAHVMIVLLDLKNANGGEPRLLTVQMPDTKKSALVGIMPAAHLLSEKNTPHFFKKLDQNFGKVVHKLTDKQFEYISRIGVKGTTNVNLSSAQAVHENDNNEDTEKGGETSGENTSK